MSANRLTIPMVKTKVKAGEAPVMGLVPGKGAEGPHHCEEGQHLADPPDATPVIKPLEGALERLLVGGFPDAEHDWRGFECEGKPCKGKDACNVDGHGGRARCGLVPANAQRRAHDQQGST